MVFVRKQTEQTLAPYLHYAEIIFAHMMAIRMLLSLPAGV